MQDPGQFRHQNSPFEATGTPSSTQHHTGEVQLLPAATPAGSDISSWDQHRGGENTRHKWCFLKPEDVFCCRHGPGGSTRRGGCWCPAPRWGPTSPAASQAFPCNTMNLRVWKRTELLLIPGAQAARRSAARAQKNAFNSHAVDLRGW